MRSLVLRMIKNRYLFVLLFINILIMFIPFYVETGYENEMRDIINYYDEVTAFDFMLQSAGSVEFYFPRFLVELFLFFSPTLSFVFWLKFRANRVLRWINLTFIILFGGIMFWFGNIVLETRFESAFESQSMFSSYVFFISWYLILLLPLLSVVRSSQNPTDN